MDLHTPPHKKTIPLDFHPLTPDRWADLESLFGERGACGGCWCMHWRLTHADYERQKGDANKQAMKALVEAGETPGLLAYADGRPVAWCAVAPRAAYPRLHRSRILKPVDETPVWSVVCFFVDKAYRHQGVSVRLLRAVCAYVKDQGGAVVEGYPTEPAQGAMPSAFAWTGLASAFVQAGFQECARRSQTRPIMRFYV